MEQVIYGDILFLINFSMDFLSLYITGKIMNLRQRVLRLSIGAALGAIYSIISLFIYNELALFLINILVSFIMCAISYKISSLASYLCNVTLFWGINLFLGGAMTFIFNALAKYTENISSGGEIHISYGKIPLSAFFITAAISVAVAYFIASLMKGKIRDKKSEIIVSINGKSQRYICLLDSGNLLCEPISGAPVVIISYNAAKRLLSEFLLQAISSGDVCQKESDMVDMRRIRIIPSTVVGQNSIIYGVLPDKVEIIDKNGKRKYEKMAVIAVDTKNSRFGDCDGIIPTVLID